MTKPDESGARIESGADRLAGTYVELIIRLGALGLLLFLAFELVRPFITIALWSVILTVALYPAFNWICFHLGGRRRLAAFVITLISLLTVVGPVTWLTLSLVDTARLIYNQFDFSTFSLPPPSASVKDWPLIGEPIYQFWELASTNLQAAAVKIMPQLKPLATRLLGVAATAGTSTVVFFVAIIVSGFLFAPAPALIEAVRSYSRKLDPTRGDEFVNLAGATIRSVSRGVIGISVLQSLLAGTGMVIAGIPGAGLLSILVLICGIIQIGPSIIVIPVIILSWLTMETTSALLFTIYMVPVNLLDNILRPIVMSRGLQTPTLVILVGVIGGVLAYGVTGLFLGPIALAVVWELLSAWTKGQSTKIES